MLGDNQRQIAHGLKVLQHHSLAYTASSYQKLQAMQNVYLSRTTISYSSEEKALIQHYLSSLIHKFHMATLALEQLWALSHEKRGEVWNAIEFSLGSLKVDDEELTLISFVFETFLFHARAYIDFYMLYICYLLKTNHEGSISKSKFRKEVEKIADGELGTKANQVLRYFDTQVFAEYNENSFPSTNWGSLITSIRDKIAHRDIIKPSFNSKETLAQKILFDWPTIRNITYDRFDQDMQNGMYVLIQDISPILYDIEWIPGPYKVGMFDNLK